MGRSSLYCIFVSEFGYLAAFSNAGSLNLSDVLNDAKFRTFDPPPPVKMKGGVGEIPIPIVEALSTTEPPKYNFDGRPLRGCCLRWIEKRQRKKKKEVHG